MQTKEKIGFVHLPRTGGTYLEGVLSSLMTPQEFINFFGTPESQIPNKLGVVERIAKDKQRQDCILDIPNWQTAKIFSGHFSLNIESYLPPEYNYSYITILRNPITRAYSFVKKITTSGGFRRVLTANDSEKIGSDIFWDNFIEYYTSDCSTGLSSHEIHGFSNYMTKVFSGSDLSESVINVDNDLFIQAKKNLSKMKYIGLFENYEKSVIDFLNIFGLSYDRLTVRESQNKNIENQKIADFIASINKYDIELYKEFSQ